jgi:KUP system potassium uptake protein
MLNIPGALAPDVAPLVRKPLGPLVIGAIGIVFGDIGTSPLYTLRECFTGPHGLPLTPDNVLGILSVVFWAIMIVVTLKYVTLIMRADNRGEGGIMALTALASRGLETAGPGCGWSAWAFSARRCFTATA